MSAKQHLKELQVRLMIVAAFFIVGASLAYAYQDQLIPFLLAPIGSEKLVYLNPGGGFSFIFLVSIYAGIALAFPIIIQQLYAFLRPALPSNAQKRSSIIIVGSLLLLTAGIAFGYYVAVPSAINFLYGFADKYVEASLTADSYLNFVIAYTIGIGIVFQIPLILLLVHAVKPLTPGGLLRSEKWVLLIAFIIAAIITPTPDPVNQAIIAGPVVVVYQIGVAIILFSILRKRRANKKTIHHAVKRARQVKKQGESAPHKTPSPAPAPLAPAHRPLASHATIAGQQHVRRQRHLTMDGVARPQHLQTQVKPMHTTQPQAQKPTFPQGLAAQQFPQHVAHAPKPVTMPPQARPARSMDGFKAPARGRVQPAPRPVNQKAERSVAPRFSIDGITPQRVSSY